MFLGFRVRDAMDVGLTENYAGISLLHNTNWGDQNT